MRWVTQVVPATARGRPRLPSRAVGGPAEAPEVTRGAHGVCSILVPNGDPLSEPLLLCSAALRPVTGRELRHSGSHGRGGVAAKVSPASGVIPRSRGATSASAVPCPCGLQPGLAHRVRRAAVQAVDRSPPTRGSLSARSGNRANPSGEGTVADFVHAEGLHDAAWPVDGRWCHREGATAVAAVVPTACTRWPFRRRRAAGRAGVRAPSRAPKGCRAAAVSRTRPPRA